MAKPTQTQTAAGAAAADEALAQLRQLSPPLPVDEFHGVGGSYVIENGVRRRVAGPELATPVAPDGAQA